MDPFCHALLLFLLISLSFFSSSDRGSTLAISNISNMSPWGEFRGYQYYALAFALSQALFAAAVGAVVAADTASPLPSPSALRGRGRGRISPTWQPAIFSTCLLVLHFLYLPVNLTVFRLYHCSSGFLSADTSLECGGSQHLIFTVICSFLALPFTVGVPIVTYRLIQVRTSVFSVFYIYALSLLLLLNYCVRYVYSISRLFECVDVCYMHPTRSITTASYSQCSSHGESLWCGSLSPHISLLNVEQNKC
jgi:hypothetical protein